MSFSYVSVGGYGGPEGWPAMPPGYPPPGYDYYSGYYCPPYGSYPPGYDYSGYYDYSAYYSQQQQQQPPADWSSYASAATASYAPPYTGRLDCVGWSPFNFWGSVYANCVKISTAMLCITKCVWCGGWKWINMAHCEYIEYSLGIMHIATATIISLMHCFKCLYMLIYKWGNPVCKMSQFGYLQIFSEMILVACQWCNVH